MCVSMKRIVAYGDKFVLTMDLIPRILWLVFASADMLLHPSMFAFTNMHARDYLFNRGDRLRVYAGAGARVRVCVCTRVRVYAGARV